MFKRQFTLSALALGLMFGGVSAQAAKPVAAANENTGNTKNKPSMRRAKMDANEPLARSSVRDMVGLSSSVGSGVRFIVTACYCPAFLAK